MPVPLKPPNSGRSEQRPYKFRPDVNAFEPVIPRRGGVVADRARAFVFADRVRSAAALRRLKDIAALRHSKDRRGISLSCTERFLATLEMTSGAALAFAVGAQHVAPLHNRTSLYRHHFPTTKIVNESGTI
jgi:hypothetical protein